jgi:hypothetical protein
MAGCPGIIVFATMDSDNRTHVFPPFFTSCGNRHQFSRGAVADRFPLFVNIEWNEAGL